MLQRGTHKCDGECNNDGGDSNDDRASDCNDCDSDKKRRLIMWWQTERRIEVVKKW